MHIEWLSQGKSQKDFMVRTADLKQGQAPFIFTFYPAFRKGRFKLSLDGRSEQKLPHDFQKTTQTLRDYFHKFVLTDDYLTAAFILPNVMKYFALLQSDNIWMQLRFHEIAYLQLQFYSPEFKGDYHLLQTHSAQNELNACLRAIKVKFWFELGAIEPS